MKPNYYLREERKRRGWSQARLAELLGTEAVTVGRWERGISFPYPYFREKLCQLFGKSAQELGLLDNETEHPTTDSIDITIQTSTVPSSALYDPAIPLPLQHPLIGRNTLFLTLKQQLLHGNRPVALYGLPGAGKTTLATSLAHEQEILAAFPDGVLWAGLGPQPNLLALFSRWAKLLEVPAEEMSLLHDEQSWAKTLRSAIGLRKLLLVIDDAWQIEAALALKVGGPNCTYLLTTRFPQLALLFADTSTVCVPELTLSDGIALLTHYAHEMSVVEPETTQLVQAVGSLPLALTLMGKYLALQGHGGQERRRRAAIMRLQNAGERLHLALPWSPLERSSSLPSESTLSLQSLIKVSIQLLPEQAQQAFFALSVFPAKPNSFSEEAALAVCAETSDLLDLLSDTGLLESSGPDRYMLHQTIVDFARSSLQDPMPEKRMVAYYADYIKRYTQDDNMLARENENIQIALELAHKLGMQKQLEQGVLHLVPSLQRRGLYTLTNTLLQQVYAVAKEQQDKLALVNTLLLLGEVAEWQGEHTKASNYLHEGLVFARQLDDQERVSAVLSSLGMVTMQRGDNIQAENYLSEGLQLARQRGDERRTSEIFRHLGLLAMQQGNARQAQLYFQEGLTFARQLRNNEQIFRLLINVGMAAKAQNDFQQAERQFTEAFTIAQQSAAQYYIGILLINLGQLAARRQDFVQAEHFFQEGLTLARQLRHRQLICKLLINLAEVLNQQKLYSRAVVACQEGLVLARQLELRQDTCMLLTMLGKIFVEQHDYVQADSHLQAALTLAKELDTQWLIDIVLSGVGELYLHTGRFDEAISIFKQLQGTLGKQSHAIEAQILYKLGCAEAGKGNFEQAKTLGKESLALLVDEPPTVTSEIAQWLEQLPEQIQSSSII